MSKKHVLVALFFMGAFGNIQLEAQNTDVMAQVQNWLNANGAVPWTHIVTDSHVERVCTTFTPPHPGPDGERVPIVNCDNQTVSVNRQVTNEVIPTVTSVIISSVSTPVFDAPVVTSVPSSLTVSEQQFVNCSKTATATQSISLAVAFQKSASVALNQSVTNTQSYQLQLSFKPEAGGFKGFGVQATLGFGSSQTSGTVDTTGTQITTTRTSQSSVAIAPGGAIDARLEVWPVTMTQTFHSTVVVDATVSANDKYSHLSDIMPTPSSRSFPVMGTVSTIDASDGQSTTYDIPDAASTCAAGDQSVKAIPLDARSRHVLYEQSQVKKK